MANDTDKSPLVDVRDIPAALGLLTRLPIPVDTNHATSRGGAAAWAYPIVGLIVALIACILAQGALWLGLTAPLVAGLTLATLIVLTGAMHEDGLADTADGFWGGWDRDVRLKIMKDSHIGTYGVLALALGLGLRWLALTFVIEAQLLWLALPLVCMLSRTAMVCIMTALPHARPEGLSHSVGAPSPWTAAIAVALSLVALVAFNWLWLLVPLTLTTLACMAIAKSKIGGQTGDVLGATQQLCEIAVLLAMTLPLT